jgi:hypothetical protein
MSDGGGRWGFGLRGGGGSIRPGNRICTPSSTAAAVWEGSFNMDTGRDLGSGGGAGELSLVAGSPFRRSRTLALALAGGCLWAGDIGRAGGAVGGAAASFVLFIFSKCDRSDDTGFWPKVRESNNGEGSGMATNNGRAVLPILVGLVHIFGRRGGRVGRDDAPMLPNKTAAVDAWGNRRVLGK